MNKSDPQLQQMPVLIAGGGPVGLALAGDLAWRGVECLLIEKGDGRVLQPRMDMVGIRSMEFCRRWGIVEDVESAGYNRAYPQDCAWVTNLNGYEFGREPFPAPKDEKSPAQSPQKRERCPQNFFDPVLSRFARRTGLARIEYGAELVSFSEQDSGVVATVRDIGSGQTREIRASYLVGCDGGASTVRHQLGIEMEGDAVLTYTTNVVFRCEGLEDLHTKAPAYRYIFIGPEGTWATLVAINGLDQWRFSLVGDAERRSVSEEEVKRAVVRAVGREIDIEILSMLPWVRRQLVAKSYGRGRAFIAGDSAHLTSPTGGFGMNTGILDAVNLSWKLVAAIQGWGGDALLGTYESEQRPVAIRNVGEAGENLRRMLSPRVLRPDPAVFGEDGPAADGARREYGARYTEMMKREWFSMGIHLGYVYEGSPIVVPDGTPMPRDEVSSYTQNARPGSRAPHVWLAPGKSMLDHFGREFVLLRFGADAPRADALLEAAQRAGVPMRAVDIDHAQAATLYERKLVLVRPDGQVAWRSDSEHENAWELVEIIRGARKGGASTAERQAIAQMLNPRSVVIVGMSSKPGGASYNVLKNLELCGFEGDIHLVGRSEGEIEGRRILGDLQQVPPGIDLAVLSVPAAAVADSLQGCIARGVRSAIVFASGFAEVGEEGRAAQEEMSELARNAGMRVMGPNCLGYFNFTTGLRIGFITAAGISRLEAGTKDAVAIVAQSGGVQGHLYQSLVARHVAVSYSIATGNEMEVGISDLLDFLVDDESTRVVAVYAEHLGKPRQFLSAVRRARQLGKAVVLLHPGKSSKARSSAQSHTGAMAGNHAVMHAKLEREGVLMADTMDEMLDLSELLSRYPAAQPGGLGIITSSGAFCAIAHDFCEELNVDVPELSESTRAALAPKLPDYIPPRNPLDLGTQFVFQPELLGHGVKGVLDDPNIGATVISIPMATPEKGVIFLRYIIEAKQGNPKPLGLVMLNDSQPLPPEFMQLAYDNKIVLSRSADRTIRVMAKLLRLRDVPSSSGAEISTAAIATSVLPPGTVPEWEGKRLLAQAGIAVPNGDLARTAGEAVAIARRVGYPVALKAQASQLAHKTEAGGVKLALVDDGAVEAAWTAISQSVDKVQPGLKLDGMLVEQMSSKGTELVVGATRDAQWGPMVLVGLGGILVEVLKDVRLISPDAREAEVIAEIEKLKAAAVLKGYRNMPAADVRAVAAAVRAIGRLMLEHPEISEIDVNPLMVHAEGRGATALDALVVAS